MILRLLRARVVAGEEARLQRFIRDEAVARALKLPGLVSFQPALRETPDGVEFVIVSAWEGFEELTAAGLELGGMLGIPGSESMLTDRHAEHYELVIGEARAMPLREAKLRLTRIPIRPGAEATYYRTVRQWSDRLLDETGMVAFTLGRRVVGRQDEIVAVQIWEDEAALRAAAGSDVSRPMGEDELSGFWAAEPAIEHFDALTATEPRPNAPAILLADDERRYVHATPAAAQLSGHSLARLLTMRVEDVARAAERPAVPEVWSRFVLEGSMTGPYVLERPDGSEVEVHFASKANTPWPGSHASLLVPADAGVRARASRTSTSIPRWSTPASSPGTRRHPERRACSPARAPTCRRGPQTVLQPRSGHSSPEPTRDDHRAIISGGLRVICLVQRASRFAGQPLPGRFEHESCSAESAAARPSEA